MQGYIKKLEKQIRIFEVFIIILTIIVIFLSLCSLFERFYAISKSIFTILNTIINDLTYSLGFHSELFREKIEIKDILITVAEVLAGILAIVLAVSLFIIENLSRTRVFTVDYYKNKVIGNKLYYFLGIIICSILFLFSYNIFLPLIQYLLLLVVLISFVWSVMLFARYFYDMLRLMDLVGSPERQKDYLNERLIDAINKQEEIKEVISRMGDSAVESVQKREENACIAYIDALYAGFEHYLESKDRRNDGENEN